MPPCRPAALLVGAGAAPGESTQELSAPGEQQHGRAVGGEETATVPERLGVRQRDIEDDQIEPALGEPDGGLGGAVHRDGPVADEFQHRAERLGGAGITGDEQDIRYRVGRQRLRHAVTLPAGCLRQVMPELGLETEALGLGHRGPRADRPTASYFKTKRYFVN